MEIVLKEFRNRFLMFFDALGAAFLTPLSLENKLENETIFNEIPNSYSGIGEGRFAGFLGPLRS